MSATTATVELQLDLYSADGVAAAVAAYEHLGTFAIDQDEGAMRVTISNPDPEVAEILVDEFANHALFETIERRGQDPA